MPSEPRLQLTLNGIVASARLRTATAPEMVAQLIERLPIEADLVQSKWSGHAASVVMPHEPLRATMETAVSLIDVGVIAVPESGAELLISYGPAVAMAATGIQRATRVADLDDNRQGFLGELSRVATEGSFRIILELVP